MTISRLSRDLDNTNFTPEPFHFADERIKRYQHEETGSTDNEAGVVDRDAKRHNSLEPPYRNGRGKMYSTPRSIDGAEEIQGSTRRR